MAFPRLGYSLAHELDAAWIIALWKAIHGGDPAPETVAAQAIAALAPYLHAGESAFTFAQLQKQLGAVNIAVTEKDVQASAAEKEEKTALELRRPVYRQYCFKFGGQTICVDLPAVRLPNV